MMKRFGMPTNSHSATAQVAEPILTDTRITDLETALRAAQSTIGGLEMEVARLTVEAGKDAALRKEWDDSAKYLLDKYPKSVRSCYKGGPESLIESMCITFIGMQAAITGISS